MSKGWGRASIAGPANSVQCAQGQYRSWIGGASGPTDVLVDTVSPIGLLGVNLQTRKSRQSPPACKLTIARSRANGLEQQQKKLVHMDLTYIDVGLRLGAAALAGGIIVSTATLPTGPSARGRSDSSRWALPSPRSQ